MKNKICTNIEQSKKLIELGIDVNTADMYYPNRIGVDNYPLPIEWKNGLPLLSQEIPCWSLAALVELLPPFIWQRKFGRNVSYWLHITKRTLRYEYHDESYDGYDYLLRATDDNDCLLDAICSAIIKLKEKDLL